MAHAFAFLFCFRYRSSFRDIGVRGLDLLSAGKEEITHFGIVDPVHVRRFEVSLEQLKALQNSLEADAGYNDLRKQCEDLKTKSPPYNLPKKMEFWAPVDVMWFLSQERYAKTLHMFIKPLANNFIGGKELLALCATPKMVSIFRSSFKPLL